MTQLTLKTYAASDVATPLATLQQRGGKWQWESKARGTGQCDVPESTADADIPPGALVAVHLEGVADPVFAWVIDEDPIVAAGKNTGVIRLAGPGAMRILDYGQVWPPDCPLPGDEIVFGWQHPDFDDTGWGAVQVHGTVADEPWQPPRPTGFPVKEASFITDDTADGQPRTVRYRRTYTFAENTLIGFAVSADDELPELWLNGVRITEVEFSGEFQWKTYRYLVLEVCAGDFTIAGKTENLSRATNTPEDNPTWLLLAGALPSGDGLAQAANELVTVLLPAATTGTWHMFVNGTPSMPIAYNAAENDVAEAVGTAADDTVTVTKTGDSSWDIEFDGPRHANTPVLTSVANLDADVAPQQITQREGASGRVVEDSTGAPVMTDSTWVMHQGDVDPGMTPGKIVRLCLEAAQARGVTDLDHVTLGFTDTNDSDGNLWPTVLLRAPMQDTTVGRIVDLLSAMGFQFDMSISGGALVLDGWVQGARGADLRASVVLTRSDIVLGSLGRKHDTIRNVIRSVTTDEFHDTADAASIAAYGRREATSADAVFESTAEADQYAQADLDNLAQPQVVSEFAVSPGAPRPYLDGYGPADIITCPTREGQQPSRVVGITGEIVGGTALKLSLRTVT